MGINTGIDPVYIYIHIYIYMTPPLIMIFGIIPGPFGREAYMNPLQVVAKLEWLFLQHQIWISLAQQWCMHCNYALTSMISLL